MSNRKIEDLETILDIYKVVSSTLDTKEILYLIVKKVSEIMSVARCSIILVDRAKNTGHILSTYEDPELNDLTIDLSKYPEILKAIGDNETVIISNVGMDPLMNDVRNKLLNIGIKSIIVIPIQYSDETIGTLYLRTSRKMRRFREQDIKRCEIIANMAAVALKNAHLFTIIRKEKAHLEKLAVTDDLTRLYNHRYFVKRLKEELKRAKRYNNSISCIMLDIDNFKGVNDTYGHQSGDRVLQQVAKVITSSVRETDVVARYGGEEFAVILPHTDRESAFNLANRIRKAIKGFKFDVLKEGEQITASIGVSTYPHPAIKEIDDIIRRADSGLYQAKNRGKDVVIGI